jgi:hypothetical protein
MLGAITTVVIDAIKEIIGLLAKRDENRKTRLEIRKLEREAFYHIQPATFEDVRKYDPKVQDLERKIVVMHGLGKPEAVAKWGRRRLIHMFGGDLLARRVLRTIFAAGGLPLPVYRRRYGMPIPISGLVWFIFLTASVAVAVWLLA